MGLVKNLALMAYISVGCSLSPILVGFLLIWEAFGYTAEEESGGALVELFGLPRQRLEGFRARPLGPS